MKKIISLILLAALLCAGCAQQAATETTAATEALATEPAEKPISYILYAIGPEDDLLEADMMQDELYRRGFGYDEMYIEFNADGTGYMNLMGMDVGGLRMPLCEMAPANEEKLRASMAACGLL